MSTPPAVRTATALLRAEDLVKRYPVRHGLTRRLAGHVAAVNGVSLEVRAGETLGLVGESGCGKSTLGRMLTRLIEPTSGSVCFDGRELCGLGDDALRPVRRELQMIFQDPFSSLNPRQTVRQILTAPFRYQHLPPGEPVEALLERVGLRPEHARRHPHEFSGGQAQRIGIARALALRPRLVVCDEPVSALDVSVQAQILNLLADLQDELGLAYVFIAHDLGVVRQISTRIAVMYLGTIVEIAGRDALFARPAHPYTHALLAAVPLPDPDAERNRERVVLRGDPPSPLQPPSGCPFRTRCPRADERCAAEKPVLRDLAPGHRVACHHPEETPA
ncbi:dipeptide/oligopeptide/nickel ABC transporter ATP-binding protein [Streptomyces cinnamoneus]|uniref:Dipeptide/oligopeptide/nickel ABC transporter ATP-binding protein n=1 Tax=Streptomyces cinnamoneus TaxID=53446 RepID=A0A2G1XNR3_STRCJ|nr:oligopeptide/dipeptide ABC transporter ATP-binding protein [Streptomyces cinnamoneus]PHQ52856.1 dipeptide/oligopeptide/nickel ABC transporter ATP-binding protein [Streptomyces cinnamoneus]PPT11488.1 dipeptide/oligopeptide/nickel ABC transporter ATP-binding protein [Streptomyces cinnamoneus]